MADVWTTRVPLKLSPVKVITLIASLFDAGGHTHMPAACTPFFLYFSIGKWHCLLVTILLAARFVGRTAGPPRRKG